MIDDQDIIKNKNRAEDNSANIEPYIPEYVKHGLTPIPQNLSYLSNSIEDNYDYIEEDIAQPKGNKYPEINELVLMVYDKVVDCGSHERILSLAKSILYGEHKEYAHDKISINDIIILKRLALKAGVFIE